MAETVKIAQKAVTDIASGTKRLFDPVRYGRCWCAAALLLLLLDSDGKVFVTMKLIWIL